MRRRELIAAFGGAATESERPFMAAERALCLSMQFTVCSAANKKIFP